MAEPLEMTRNYLSKHTRFGPERQNSAEYWQWHTTQALPWRVKEDRRRRRRERRRTRQQQQRRK